MTTNTPLQPHALGGSVVPLVSPLTDDETIDADSLALLIRWHRESGTNAVFVAGTCGEGPSLTERAREQLLDAALEAAGGIPVLVGVMETGTARAVSWARRIASRDAAGIVVMPPIFAFAATAEEHLSHADRIAQAAGRPVILYNFPVRTGGRNIPLEAIRRMLDRSIAAGIKESGGDVHYFRELLRLREEFPQLRVMNGELKLAGEALLLGADGLVMSYTNVDPLGPIEMIGAARRGDRIRVEQLQSKFNAVRAAVPPHVSAPAWTKSILAARGFCRATCCAPAEPLSDFMPAALEGSPEDALPGGIRQ